MANFLNPWASGMFAMPGMPASSPRFNPGSGYGTGWNRPPMGRPGGGLRYSPDAGNPNAVNMDSMSGGMQYDPGQPQMMDFGRTAISRYESPIPQQKAAPTAYTTPQGAAPAQSLDQFMATLGNPGAYTSGQVADLYAKSQAQGQPAQASLTAGQQPPPNFWQNVGPGGTANPFPTMGAQPFNPAWGQQRFGFDPRSLAGQQVTGDLSWYYGRDAIGRPINRQGDAAPTFSGPADGFQRRRPWMG